MHPNFQASTIYNSQDIESTKMSTDRKMKTMWYISEKAMAIHSSTLAWKIPWMEEPGGLKSMGSLRVGHD